MRATSVILIGEAFGIVMLWHETSQCLVSHPESGIIGPSTHQQRVITMNVFAASTIIVSVLFALGAGPSPVVASANPVSIQMITSAA